jgi:hypothetical protein
MIMFVMAKCIGSTRVSRARIECMARYWKSAYGRSVYISYGGMLMNLEGSYRKLSKLAHDNVYLLIRK